MKILPDSPFSIEDDLQFRDLALDVFHYQSKEVPLYQAFVDLLGAPRDSIRRLEAIPFLPIEFFKSAVILDSLNSVFDDSTANRATKFPQLGEDYEKIFTSSRTTGSQPSTHYVKDLRVYETSFLASFRRQYGEPSDYTILALLPSYLEQGDSSLIYMVDALIQASGRPDSGYFLYDHEKLYTQLTQLKSQHRKTILIGVTFALLDFVEQFAPLTFPDLVVIETGGMKGKRKEIIRQEVHARLCRFFGVVAIHSEYGMTELLSQAYSPGLGIFYPPSWMKILIREAQDPLSFLPTGRVGGLNVIDLANIHSCSFIATQDLGKNLPDGGFEVLGRFDSSDIRGCNLLVEA